MMDRRPDNFIHLCRLCASYDAVKLDLFGDEGQERSLVQKIQTCLPFQVGSVGSWRVALGPRFGVPADPRV